jgi:hypothetical protein
MVLYRLLSVAIFFLALLVGLKLLDDAAVRL